MGQTRFLVGISGKDRLQWKGAHVHRALPFEDATKTVAEDDETITIQFTWDEADNIRSAVNYVASLFDDLDREALDGWRMSQDDADRFSTDLFNVTIGHRTAAKAVRGK